MAKKRLQRWLAFCLAVSMLMGTTALAADGDENEESQYPIVTVTEDSETTEPTETPFEKGEDEITVVLKENETTSNTNGQEGVISSKTEYDPDKQTDVTIETIETPREVTVTTGEITVQYDKDPDAYEGQTDLEFPVPVWNSNIKDLGGTQIDNKWKYNYKIHEKVEGYDYMPYGFAQNDVQHYWYINANADGEMVDMQGDPVYYYDKATDSYTRFLPEEVEIYDIATGKNGEKVYYQVTEEDGTVSYKAAELDEDGYVSSVVNNGNGMITYMMDVSKTHSEAMWNEVSEDLNSLVALMTGGAATTERNAAMAAFKQEHPDFYNILDLERLVEDYQDGEITEDTRALYNAIYGLLQYDVTNKNFISPENAIPAYCVDLNTSTVAGSWYDIMNAEDVGYYSTERTAENGYVSDADRIKAIAAHGYWGTNEGQGSLASMKAFFQEKLDAATAAGETLPYTQDDIDQMTNGDALSITQHALWEFGHSLEDAYTDAYTKDKPDKDARIERFVEYFTTMPINVDDYEADDVYTEEKFIGEMSLTVGDRIKGHENNQDDNDDNDAYDTSLNFSLVVVPGEDDDLVVSIVDNDGTVLAKARIAGDDSADDETFTGNLVENGDGNYTFTNLPLIENSNQTFSLNLEGAQYLEEGVYIFRSANGEDASQTFVTYAEGTKAVDLEAKVDFVFDVKEGTVKERRTWEKKDLGDDDDDDDDIFGDDDDDDTPKGDDDDDDDDNTVIGDDDVPQGELPGDDDDDLDEIPEEDTPKTDISEEDVPLEELPEDDVPLAEVPKTGDASILWFALSALSGAGLVGLNLTKKREDEE